MSRATVIYYWRNGTWTRNKKKAKLHGGYSQMILPAGINDKIIQYTVDKHRAPYFRHIKTM